MGRAYELSILSPAQADLEEIARVHMALSGPQSAHKITEKIYDAMEQLTRLPMSGPLLRDEQLNAAGYRYIPAKKYLVIYRFFGGAVIIYHIANGTTDYPKLIKQFDA